MNQRHRPYKGCAARRWMTTARFLSILIALSSYAPHTL